MRGGRGMFVIIFLVIAVVACWIRYANVMNTPPPNPHGIMTELDKTNSMKKAGLEIKRGRKSETKVTAERSTTEAAVLRGHNPVPGYGHVDRSGAKKGKILIIPCEPGGKPSCPTAQTVGQLKQLIVPNYTLCPDPVRVGSQHDGGYVACSQDSLKGAEAVLSFGISGQDDWGCDVARISGARLLEFDCFVTTRPACTSNLLNLNIPFFFLEECLGSVDQDERACVSGRKTATTRSFDPACNQTNLVPRTFKTLSTIFNDWKLWDAADLTLKIDIEGGEWDAFNSFSDAHWERVGNLFFEMHLDGRGLPYHVPKDPKHITEAYLSALQKLDKHFVLIHIAINNCFGAFKFGSLFIPVSQELAFVNRRLAAKYSPGSGGISRRSAMRQHQSLDAKVCDYAEDTMSHPAIKKQYYPDHA